MSEKIQAVRGMNDVLPSQTTNWRYVEAILARCLLQYGYQEIRLPIVESTQLFKRTIGEVTDIVEKEMYTFTDLNGSSISLRPEGTAGCVRACIEHGLLHNQQQKLWYQGPMFRHEKPQKGRYRQFNQFGVEALGIAGTGIELELIAINQRFWRELGIQQAVKLEINTLGELAERQVYKTQLTEFLQSNRNYLDEDSLRRLTKNPLRILDSKNKDMQALLVNAPKLIDTLGESSRDKFARLCQGLDCLGIAYNINPLLVRGLDYYSHTVFEWVTDKLGSQATVCAGGRYDALVEQLGGQPVPAIGFALGIERLLLLIEALGIQPVVKKNEIIFFIIADGEHQLQHGLIMAEELRDHNADWQVITNTAGGSFKSQFKKADKSGADFAIIIGEEELKNEQVTIKNLRRHENQVTIARSHLCKYFDEWIQA